MKEWIFVLSLLASLLALSASSPFVDPCSYCVHNAKCENQQCVCEDGFTGDGNFVCIKREEFHVCKILNDPTMQTFAEENVLLETFGSSRFAELSTGRRTGVGENGMCRFSSTAFMERVLGKIFIQGVTFELVQEDMLGQQVYLEVAVRAEVIDGRYRYAIETRESMDQTLEHQVYISPVPFPGEETTVTLVRHDCDVVFRLFPGHVLSVNLACCGIRVGVRPFHPAHKMAIPGLWVMVKKIFNPTFPMWEPGTQPLCMSPDPSAYSIKDVVEQTGLSDVRAAMSFQALTNPGRHSDTTPDDQRRLAEVLKDCPHDRLQMFYDEAGFIKESPPFINCISGNSHGQDYIVSLMLHSARYYCYGWRWSCRCSVQMVKDRCKHLVANPARYPRVAAYARQSCDAL